MLCIVFQMQTAIVLSTSCMFGIWLEKKFCKYCTVKRDEAETSRELQPLMMIQLVIRQISV